MRRRLDLAASFIVAPRVLFLDEPTAGLDPLADAISVIAAGRVVAAGHPDELKSLAGGDRIDIVLRAARDLIPAARLLHARLGAEVSLDHGTRALSVPVTDRLAALAEVIRSLEDENITAEDVTVRRPTLDEAFRHLTGPRQ